MDSAIRSDAADQPTASQLEGSGMLAATWSLAGGVACGILAAALVLVGYIHADGAVLTMTAVLAAVGSALGMVHGAVLGYLGGSPATPGEARDTRATSWGPTVAVTASTAALSIILALWLALSALLVREGSLVAWASLVLGGAVGLAILFWATLLSWRTLEHAYSRWPDHRLGTWLLAGVFVVSAAVLLMIRPAVPRTALQLSPAAVLAIAAAATLWIAGPAVVVGLRIWHRRHDPAVVGGPTRAAKG